MPLGLQICERTLFKIDENPPFQIFLPAMSFKTGLAIFLPAVILQTLFALIDLDFWRKRVLLFWISRISLCILLQFLFLCAFQPTHSSPTFSLLFLIDFEGAYSPSNF